MDRQQSPARQGIRKILRLLLTLVFLNLPIPGSSAESPLLERLFPDNKVAMNDPGRGRFRVGASRWAAVFLMYR
ncbi:MAG TPA: hypothetical protein DC058_18240 [Planctomycetaceae bacterium]|nr:hypothetical protein [Planctomycetaceae bacterium]HBC63142.1 hypothetical protein [Planctomycetaceae bacterium]